MVFTARRSYASAVLGVVILSVCPSFRLSVLPSVRLSHACLVTNPKNVGKLKTFVYTKPDFIKYELEVSIRTEKMQYNIAIVTALELVSRLGTRKLDVRLYVLENGRVRCE